MAAACAWVIQHLRASRSRGPGNRCGLRATSSHAGTCALLCAQYEGAYYFSSSNWIQQGSFASGTWSGNAPMVGKVEVLSSLVQP